MLKAQEPSARYLAALRPGLVEHFDLVASAPGGVASLRELILKLAVQGKLVRQESHEAPAATLIREIRRERDRLTLAGKITPQESAARPAGRQQSPDLPSGWERVRFGDYVHELCTGPFGSLIHKDDYVEDGVPLINPSHMVRGRVQPDRKVAVSEKMAAQLGAYRLSPGDVLLARRGEVGRYALVTAREAGWLCGTGSFFVRLASSIDRTYFGLMLQDPRLRAQLQAESVGATMTNLNQRILLQVPLAIPPLAEQARIVARVEELMRLCDALEAQGRLEDAQHAQLLDKLLGTLTDSASPEELAANWQRIAAHFDRLLDRPEAVEALEQTILELAVRGLLVHQEPTEPPATEFLRHLQAAQAQSKSVEKSSETLDAVLDPNGAPFEVPPGWTWVRFGAVVGISGGVTLGRKTPIAKPVVRPYLRVANVQRWRLDLSVMKDVVVDQSELARFQLRLGDLLITEGGDWDKVGRTTIWRDEIPECLHQNHVFKARGFLDEWLPAWAELYLNSAMARRYFAASAKQTTNLASINMTQLKACPLPLPPVAEQRRIVARVKELRRLCADLREKLTKAQTTQARLADVLVESTASAG